MLKLPTNKFDSTLNKRLKEEKLPSHPSVDASGVLNSIFFAPGHHCIITLMQHDINLPYIMVCYNDTMLTRTQCKTT